MLNHSVKKPWHAHASSFPKALSEQEAACERSPKDAHLDHGIEEGLRFTDDQVFLTEQAVGQAVPIDDENVARFEVLQQDELKDQQVADGLGRHANDQAHQQTNDESLNDVFSEERREVHAYRS